MNKEIIRGLANIAGLDEFKKLSDPPIRCYSGTENQFETFVDLVRREYLNEWIAAIKHEQSVNKQQNEIEQKRALGMSFPY